MGNQEPEQTTADTNNRWAIALTSISLLGFIALIVLLISNALPRLSPLILWAILAGIMIVLLWGLGKGATGKWYGVIVEKNRNRASLSRLQVTLWTILVISSFLAMAFTRVMAAPKPPSASEIADCKAEYISQAYDLNMDELTSQTPPQEQSAEETSSPDETSETLKQAMAEAEEECVPQALKIRFPEELLLVLGISTASFAGSSLIKSNKQNKPSVEIKRIQNAVEKSRQALEDASEKLNDAQNREIAAEAVLESERNNLAGLPELLANGSPNEGYMEARERVRSAEIAYKTALEVTKKINNEKTAVEKQLNDAQGELDIRKDQGLLVVASEPRFTDIFYGDQEGDAQFIDLGKVQMFFITVSILLAYGAAIGAIIQNTTLITAPLGVDFPGFSSSMTTLLGISHAGYLAVKTPDRPLSAT